MNKQERDELRDSAEKAIRFQSLDAARQATSVIRVLDAWEEWLNSRTQITPPECEHAHLSTVARIVEMGVSCPLCGENDEPTRA